MAKQRGAAANDDDAGDGAGDDGKGGDDGGTRNTTLTDGDLATIRQTVVETINDLFGDDDGNGAAGGGGDDDGGAAGDSSSSSPTSSPASVEGAAEDAVRRAMERLQREGDFDDRLKQVESKVREETPRQLRRITRIFWGSDEKVSR